jgi:hypothetical protein
MPIHLNPFRLYKGRVCLNHGILVEMLRCTQKFWVAYQQLLEINSKKESNIKDLNTLMKKMELTPKDKGKITLKKRLKAQAEITKNFDDGINELDTMSKNLTRIIYDDETFLYRAVKQLRGLYLKFGKIKHVPDHMRNSALRNFHALLVKMNKFQEHTWVIAKAHARERFKIAEVSIFTTRSKRRHIRKDTIELDHICNRIEPLKEKIEAMRIIRTHEDLHRLHKEIHSILDLYHLEIEDVEEIMRESEILIKRTEKLFKAIEHEATSLGFKKLKKKVQNFAKKFRKLLKNIETQARRERLEIDHIVSALPQPPKHIPKHIPKHPPTHHPRASLSM